MVFEDFDPFTYSECIEDPLSAISHCNTNYIVEEKAHDFFNFKDNSGINLLHINARSVVSSSQGIESLLSNIAGTLTAIAISETWLSNAMQDSYFIPGYNFVTNCRTDGGGGGVGIFIRASLDYIIIKDLSRMLHYLECIFVEIPLIKKKNIIIGCFYRPSNRRSNADINLFNSEFKQILESLELRGNKSIFLAGDFNLDLLTHSEHPPTTDFLENLLSFSYLPSINRPTRITDHSSTLLDNIFIKAVDLQVESTIIYNDISDHFPVAIHSSGCLSFRQISYQKQRIFDKQSMENFNRELASDGCWDRVNVLCEIDNDSSSAYNCFVGNYLLLFNKHFPERLVKHNRRTTPINDWMTKGLLRSCNNKSKLYKIYKKTGSLSAREKFVIYRNILKVTLNKAKKNYYFDKFKTSSGDLRHTWHLLGNLIKSKPPLNIAESYVQFGKTITDNLDIVKKFNEYFVGIGSDLASKISPTSVNISAYLRGNFPVHFHFILPMQRR